MQLSFREQIDYCSKKNPIRCATVYACSRYRQMDQVKQYNIILNGRSAEKFNCKSKAIAYCISTVNDSI